MSCDLRLDREFLSHSRFARVVVGMESDIRLILQRIISYRSLCPPK
jgi:hypothetical protein